MATSEAAFFDQKGPMVFSATLHLLALVAWMIFALLKPDKKPEELVFELQVGGAAAPQAAPTYEPVRFDSPPVDQSEVQELIDEAAARKPPPAPAPTPVVRDEAPAPPKEVVKPAPKPAPPPPKQVTFDQFQKEVGPVKVTNVPKEAPKAKPVDLSKQADQIARNLSALRNSSLPATKLNAMSSSQQNELASYFARLKQAIMQSMEKHPLSARRLETVIQFDLSPTGRLSNTSVRSGSGDSGFDAKAVDAFKRVGFFEAPPGFAATETLTITIVQAER